MRGFMERSWPVYAICSALFAALTALLMKFSLTTVNSNFATLIRTLVVVALSLGVVIYRSDWPQDKMNTKDLVFIVLSGVTTGLSWLFYFKALQLGPASKVAPLDKLSVVFVILLSIIFLGEKVQVATLLGGLFILVGSLLVAMN